MAESHEDVALIASRLKQARENVRPRMNQEQAADAIGVSVSTLQKWEQGVNSPPSVHLAALARLFDVSADFLCGISIEPIDGEERILLDRGMLARARQAIADGDQDAAEDLLVWEPPMLLAFARLPREYDLVNETEAQRERRRVVFELEEAFPELIARWRKRFRA